MNIGVALAERYESRCVLIARCDQRDSAGRKADYATLAGFAPLGTAARCRILPGHHVARGGSRARLRSGKPDQPLSGPSFACSATHGLAARCRRQPAEQVGASCGGGWWLTS